MVKQERPWSTVCIELIIVLRLGSAVGDPMICVDQQNGMPISKALVAIIL